MSLAGDPRYVSLARNAAARLGGGSDLARAILGQWQCEIGNDAWPPTRNNPGNLARGFATGLGYPFTVQYPNPQPGNPIVTFRSPSDGAGAYTKGLLTFGRYATAVAAARRDDGGGFLHAVTDAHWGTNLSCALGVYNASPSSTGNVPPHDMPEPDLCAWNGKVCFPVGHPITRDDARTILAILDREGYFANVIGVAGGGKAETYNLLTDQVGKLWTVATLAAIGQSASQKAQEAVIDPGAAVAGALGSLPTQLGDVAGKLVVNGAILAVVVGLGYLGLRSILTAPGKAL